MSPLYRPFLGALPAFHWCGSPALRETVEPKGLVEFSLIEFGMVLASVKLDIERKFFLDVNLS